MPRKLAVSDNDWATCPCCGRQEYVSVLNRFGMCGECDMEYIVFEDSDDEELLDWEDEDA